MCWAVIPRLVKIFSEGAVNRLDISFHWYGYLWKGITFWVKTFNFENFLHMKVMKVWFDSLLLPKHGAVCTIKKLRMLYQHNWGTRRMVLRVQKDTKIYCILRDTIRCKYCRQPLAMMGHFCCKASYKCITLFLKFSTNALCPLSYPIVFVFQRAFPIGRQYI